MRKYNYDKKLIAPIVPKEILDTHTIILSLNITVTCLLITYIYMSFLFNQVQVLCSGRLHQ